MYEDSDDARLLACEAGTLTFYNLIGGVSESHLLQSGNSGVPRRTLSAFFGVFVPCVLSMFSVVLFLRCGISVGECGLVFALLELILAYSIIGFTLCSISAVSTNGAVEGGGAYFMISRALGPEFGGAIGILFFVANIFSSAMYVLSIVEAVDNSFGREAGTLYKIIPTGFCYELIYATLILFICFIICVISADLYAKSTFVIFLVVFIALGGVIINFFLVPDSMNIPLPAASQEFYKHNITTAMYTGFNMTTLKNNLWPHYGYDYTTGDNFTFVSVFAIIFNGCTGIMAGANMSGELKNPAFAIPIGTIGACIVTYCVYSLIVILSAATTTRFLLQANYSYLQPISFFPPLIFIGTLFATISAALSTFIGASRVLQAVARDDIFTVVTRPFLKFTSRKGNPYGSIIFSWLFIQCLLIINDVNAIMPIVSIFYLLVYMSVNLSCLSLDVAGAPNFRPSFKYFTWHTCILGILGTLVMIVLISPIYAAFSFLCLLFLIIIVSLISPNMSWGSISQALIFYAVRKFLLKLDQRKDHVKFWRPQMLLLVSNPLGSLRLIDFVNDLKKSGLYVIGHVSLEDTQEDEIKTDLDENRVDPVSRDVSSFLDLVDRLKIKAFVEVVTAPTVRQGAKSLSVVAGLGGMKPNTVIFGFYDDSRPRVDERFHSRSSGILRNRTEPIYHSFMQKFPLNEMKSRQGPKEYVSMIGDILNSRKNVCLARHFNQLDKEYIKTIAEKNKPYIDIWPVNYFRPTQAGYLDVCSLFLLQLGCILNMQHFWRKYSRLRVFLPACTGEEDLMREKLMALLNQLRIKARVLPVNWSELLKRYEFIESNNPDELSDDYLNASNAFLKQHSENSALVMLQLPAPPLNSSFHSRYIYQLNLLTDSLPPTLLVHGVSAVTTTGL